MERQGAGPTKKNPICQCWFKKKRNIGPERRYKLSFRPFSWHWVEIRYLQIIIVSKINKNGRTLPEARDATRLKPLPISLPSTPYHFHVASCRSGSFHAVLRWCGGDRLFCEMLVDKENRNKNNIPKYVPSPRAILHHRGGWMCWFPM